MAKNTQSNEEARADKSARTGVAASAKAMGQDPGQAVRDRDNWVKAGRPL